MNCYKNMQPLKSCFLWNSNFQWSWKCISGNIIVVVTWAVLNSYTNCAIQSQSMNWPKMVIHLIVWWWKAWFSKETSSRAQMKYRTVITEAWNKKQVEQWEDVNINISTTLQINNVSVDFLQFSKVTLVAWNLNLALSFEWKWPKHWLVPAK